MQTSAIQLFSIFGKNKPDMNCQPQKVSIEIVFRTSYNSKKSGEKVTKKYNNYVLLTS